MDNSKFYVYPDKSRINMGGQLYNCTDGDISGLFRNASTGEMILVGEYCVDDISDFHMIRRSIDREFFKEQDIKGLSDDELYDLESEILDIFHTDDRLKGIIYPYTYEVIENDGESVIYTINEVSDEFRSKYKKFSNVVFEPGFAINLRLNVISNILDIMKALNERFNNFFHGIDANAIFVDPENGDVNILFEKMVLNQDENGDDINSDLAYIIFELLCMASPYDGKQTLIEFPLLTIKTEKKINKSEKKFVFSNNDNGISIYSGKDILARWNALPDIIRGMLEDNLDTDKLLNTYDINDWIRVIRKLRDLLVYVRGSFRFCNPSENKEINYFDVNGCLVPIWPRKALYGYHVGIADYRLSKKILLGVNQEGKVINKSSNNMILQLADIEYRIKPGDSFTPKCGMEIVINGSHIQIITK